MKSISDSLSSEKPAHVAEESIIGRQILKLAHPSFGCIKVASFGQCPVMSAREHSHSNVDNHQKYSVSLLRVYSQARPLETRMTVPFVYIYAFRITAFLVLHRLPSCTKGDEMAQTREPACTTEVYKPIPASFRSNHHRNGKWSLSNRK